MVDGINELSGFPLPSVEVGSGVALVTVVPMGFA
jgi:hypothetical protein